MAFAPWLLSLWPFQATALVLPWRYLSPPCPCVVSGVTPALAPSSADGPTPEAGFPAQTLTRDGKEAKTVQCFQGEGNATSHVWLSHHLWKCRLRLFLASRAPSTMSSSTPHHLPPFLSIHTPQSGKLAIFWAFLDSLQKKKDRDGKTRHRKSSFSILTVFTACWTIPSAQPR